MQNMVTDLSESQGDRELAGTPASSVGPPTAERSSCVKGRPAWLNRGEGRMSVTTHTAPIYTSWIARLMRRDFYRICFGALRFKSENEEPLRTWLHEARARSEVVRAAGLNPAAIAARAPYITLAVATHNSLTANELELMLDADTAAHLYGEEGFDRQKGNDMANYLSEPFLWIKNRSVVAGTSRFEILNPGHHIKKRTHEGE